MIYLQLFWSFFQIGLFSFGGGYAAMPLIRNQIVNIHGWLDMNAFSDIITISQMTPGPIAVNSATFVGIRMAGILGAIVATAGCVLPSTIIAIVLVKLYYKYREMSVMKGIMNGLRPAVVAMIASAGLSILTLSIWQGNGFSLSLENVDFIAVGIFILSLIILRIFRPNQIIVMIGAGIIGCIAYLLF
jgi:chromate transporter